MRVVDTVHVLIFIVFVFYIPFHAYLGTLGRTPMEHFKAMFNGYEEIEEGESAEVATDGRAAAKPNDRAAGRIERACRRRQSSR